MKTIVNAKEFLLIYLDDLYNGENILQHELGIHLEIASSENLKREIRDYQKTCLKKKEKLERVINQLQFQVHLSQCKILNTILEEIKELIHSISVNHLRDAALLAGIQNIINYKKGRYHIAWALADQLQLNYTLSELDKLRGMEENTNDLLSWLANKQLFKEAAELQEIT